jgi:hypothetical protein
MKAWYLICRQRAEVLGVSSRTVLRGVAASELIAAGKMPGGTYRFVPSEVEHFGQVWEVKSLVQICAFSSYRGPRPSSYPALINSCHPCAALEWAASRCAIP